MSICEHCKNYKTKHLNGKLASEYCKKYECPLHYFIKCNGFSRSWKSRLGFVKEVKE